MSRRNIQDWGADEKNLHDSLDTYSKGEYNNSNSNQTVFLAVELRNVLGTKFVLIKLHKSLHGYKRRPLKINSQHVTLMV